MCGTLNPAWLGPTRTEALAVTDKHAAPSVNGSWHRASFGLADAESLTEAVAGGQAGLVAGVGGRRDPPPPFPRSVLSWSKNPATGRLHQAAIVPQDDGGPSPALLSLAYLSPSLLPFHSSSPSCFCYRVSPSCSSSSCSKGPPPLRSWQAQKGQRPGCEKLPRVWFFSE